MEFCRKNWTSLEAIIPGGFDPRGNGEVQIALSSGTARHKKVNRPIYEKDHAPLHNISLILGRRQQLSPNKLRRKC